MNTNGYKLGERAVLMTISTGLPGESHTDQKFSDEVKQEKHLGQKSGAWVKAKYPEWALKPIKKIRDKAKDYHDAVTLPYAKGIGILPAALIVEYGDRMRDFTAQFKNMAETHFKPKYGEVIQWAKENHNGTFDPADYPDVEEVMKKFHLRTEPLPVPDAGHFEETIKSLLGVDAESVSLRVQDAMLEGERELMRRLIAPVKAMATRLAEEPKEGHASPRFNASLVGNVRQIVELAPKLNIMGDPAIDGFVADMRSLTIFTPEHLRKSGETRKAVAEDAAVILKRLEGYKL